MEWKEQLAELRTEVDNIDEALIPLFQKRMDISKRVAAVKCEHNLAVEDEIRENQIVEKALNYVEDDIKSETDL
ncbi:MAG: chorismate mutase, partial [Clostridiaceae bacterium]|nr:chorismate mutase [Clostridiaceae bacterium]